MAHYSTGHANQAGNDELARYVLDRTVRPIGEDTFDAELWLELLHRDDAERHLRSLAAALGYVVLTQEELERDYDKWYSNGMNGDDIR